MGLFDRVHVWIFGGRKKGSCQSLFFANPINFERRRIAHTHISNMEQCGLGEQKTSRQPIGLIFLLPVMVMQEKNVVGRDVDPPTLMANENIDAIKAAFSPLLKRDVMNVADELEQADRQAFDDVVISAFDLGVDRQRIYDALLSLVEIRQTALE